MSSQSVPPLHDAAKPLSWLLGTWESEKAEGFFPTIKPFTYKETIEFSHVGQPMLTCSFNSRTLEGAPKHFEKGFLRMKVGTSCVAYIASHNIGIAEVEEGEVSGTELRLESCTISNMSFGSEPRVTKIARVFKLFDDSTLEQTVSMATSTTPELTPHLSARYKKAK